MPAQRQGPGFSGDRQWVAYGNSIEHVYTTTVRRVDGTSRAESQSYEQVWLPPDQTGGVIHFFGLRDQTFYRVEVKGGD